MEWNETERIRIDWHGRNGKGTEWCGMGLIGLERDVMGCDAMQ